MRIAVLTTILLSTFSCRVEKKRDTAKIYQMEQKKEEDQTRSTWSHWEIYQLFEECTKAWVELSDKACSCYSEQVSSSTPFKIYEENPDAVHEQNKEVREKCAKHPETKTP
ncbi:MAG: hypothetical protein AB7T49_09320 [Oligoflexales bacterium]